MYLKGEQSRWSIYQFEIDSKKIDHWYSLINIELLTSTKNMVCQ